MPFLSQNGGGGTKTWQTSSFYAGRGGLPRGIVSSRRCHQCENPLTLYIPWGSSKTRRAEAVEDCDQVPEPYSYSHASSILWFSITYKFPTRINQRWNAYRVPSVRRTTLRIDSDRDSHVMRLCTLGVNLSKASDITVSHVKCFFLSAAHWRLVEWSIIPYTSHVTLWGGLESFGFMNKKFAIAEKNLNGAYE